MYNSFLLWRSVSHRRGVCYILLVMYVEGRGEEGYWHSGSRSGDEDRNLLVQYQSSPGGWILFSVSCLALTLTRTCCPSNQNISCLPSPEAPGPVLGWDGGGQLLAVGLTLFYANLQTFFKFSARSYCSYKCSFSPVPDHAIEIYIYLYFLTLIPKAL